MDLGNRRSVSNVLAAGVTVVLLLTVRTDAGDGAATIAPEKSAAKRTTDSAPQPSSGNELSTAKEARRTYPSLPGAIEKCPDWLKRNAPFDVERYLARIPAGENAATLYLDALYEFSPQEMEECIDPAERETRGPLLKERFDRTVRLQARDPQTVNPAFRAGIVDEYKESFEKLALAQKRKQCVFEIGIGFETPYAPHAQAARHAVRMLDWRTEVDIAEERIDAALTNVEMALRLGRDLRPRGNLICQLVSMALDSITVSNLVPQILAVPDIGAADCNRLLESLSRHEAEGLDTISEGFRASYFVLRELLHRLESKRPIGDFELDRRASAAAAEMTSADFAAEIEALNRFLLPLFNRPNRTLLGLKHLRPEQEAAADKFKILEFVVEDVQTLGESVRRHRTRMGATECLIALRRWQLTHGNVPPADLAAVCKDAEMMSVPIDEYSEEREALRMAKVGNEFVIYSVAKDGKDDMAQRDWNWGASAGDWIFRLPPIRTRDE